jgi:hypothetical protein
MTPVLDTIASLIVSRLQAGTYTGPYQIKEVKRPNQKHGNVVAKPFLCLVQMVDLGDTEGSNYEEEGGPNPYYRITATYVAETEVMQDEESNEPHDALASYLLFDMAKAIATAAGNDWAQWGGNAINSRWRPAVATAEDGSIMSVGLIIEVDVSLKSTDPYVSRG